MVSLLAFMHWLETGSLLMHSEAEEKLGCKLLLSLLWFLLQLLLLCASEWLLFIRLGKGFVSA